MKKTILFTILIVSLTLTGCALKKSVEVGEDIQSEINNSQPISSTSMDGQEEQGDATQTGTSVSSVRGNDKIKVFNISDNQTVYSPLTVSGQAVAFENNLIVELRNSDHETLVKEFTTIKSSKVGEMGDYSIKLNFDFKNTKEGFVAVYEQGEDGLELNLAEIPVKFGNLDTSNWQTYKNKEYGVEFKYPGKWLVYSKNYDENNFLISLSEYGDQIEKYGEIVEEGPAFFSISFLKGVDIDKHLSEVENSLKKSGLEYENREFSLEELNYSKKEVEFLGEKAIEVKHKAVVYDQIRDFNVSSILFENGDNLTVVSLNTINKNNQNVGLEILNSFKFTN